MWLCQTLQSQSTIHFSLLHALDHRNFRQARRLIPCLKEIFESSLGCLPGKWRLNPNQTIAVPYGLFLVSIRIPQVLRNVEKLIAMQSPRLKQSDGLTSSPSLGKSRFSFNLASQGLTVQRCGPRYIGGGKL